MGRMYRERGNYDGIWSKTMVIITWLLQIGATGLIGIVAVAAIALWKTFLNDKDNGLSADEKATDIKETPTFYAVVGVFIGICVILFLFVVFEIVQYRRGRLSPIMMLSTTAIGTVFWIAMLGMSIAGAVKHGNISPAVYIVILTIWLLKLSYAGKVLFDFKRGKFVTPSPYPMQPQVPVMQDPRYEPFRGAEPKAATAGTNPFRDPSPAPTPFGDPASQGDNMRYYGASSSPPHDVYSPLPANQH